MSEKLEKVYTIKEVSELTGVPIYKIRQWEKKVKRLKPHRHPKNNWRYYTDKEINTIKNIKRLLDNREITLKGVDKELIEIELGEIDKIQTKEEIRLLLRRIKLELLEMKTLLQSVNNVE
ncbi:MAG: MerR family transcriptional regulator [Candidatus Hydrogenedentes bacterium]|nr:MerR family transcriptional regulator [Candidatus Hydrogenedentota bacterium]